jgi:hypothetical protein
MSVTLSLPDATTLPANAPAGFAPIVASVPIGAAAVTTTEGASNGVSAQISVGAAATLIAAARVGRKGIVIQNLGATDVWLGFANTVAASNGLLLLGTRGATFFIDGGAPVWAIASSGAQPVAFAEIY